MPLNKEYKSMIGLARTRGLIKARIMENDPSGKGLSLYNINKLDFAQGSEQFSSEASFGIGLRLASDKGLTEEAAYNFARNFLMNEAKPLYGQANKLNLLLGKEWGGVRRTGLFLMTYPIFYINKLFRTSLASKMLLLLFLIATVGAGNMIFGRRLLEKAGLNKPFYQWTVFDKFLVAGIFGAMGIDPKFLIPFFNPKGINTVGSITRGMQYYLDQLNQMDKNIQKYGGIGGMFNMPLGGLEHLIAGWNTARRGIIRLEGGDRVVWYRPKSDYERGLLTAGLTPLGVGEKYYQENKKRDKAFWKKKVKTWLK